MIPKKLRKVLGIAALVGGFFMPRSHADTLRVGNNGISASDSTYMSMRHKVDSYETNDANDAIFTDGGNPSLDTNRYFKIVTTPYTTELSTDSRPTNSETLFNAQLKFINQTGSPIASSIFLSFSFRTGAGSPKDTNRMYIARVYVNPQYTTNGQAFNCVTNIRNIVSAGGILPLPNLWISNSCDYGTLDVSCKFLAEPQLTVSSSSTNQNTLNLETAVQSGSYATDIVEYAASATNPAWQAVATNNWGYTTPTSNNFNSTEARTNQVDITDKTNGFYRVKRIWSTE